MDYLPPNFLKKQRKMRACSTLDLVTLLYNIHVGANEVDVGFEDAQETIETITRKLNRKWLTDPALLESALWSCNMMHEAGKFWDVKGRTFEEFAKSVLEGDRFDLVYNVIKEDV